MFWRRRNEGFKWVRYVPTQVIARRRERRESIERAKAEAAGLAKEAARKSWDGAKAGAGIAGQAIGRGAVSAAGGLGGLSMSLLRSLGAPSAALAARFGVGRIAVIGLGLGALLAAGGVIRLLNTANSDTEGRIVLAAGLALLALVGLPLAWRHAGPHGARLALDLLRTRKAGDGPQEGAAAARLALPVAAAAALAAVTGVGWLASGWIASAPPITGRAVATGPQTLRVGQTELRLHGIAAPEAEQRCGEGSRRWRCGQDAQKALAGLANGKVLACSSRGQDESGRTLARCLDGERDLAAQLVKDGYAWADRADTAGYRRLETEAKTANAGVWRAPSTPPWEWRAKLWDEAKRSAPEGCPIKAEATGSAKVYHLPWSASYERVRIGKAAERRGAKRWFCTEREAQEAGYRPA